MGSRGLSTWAVVVIALIFGSVGGGIGAYVLINSMPSGPVTSLQPPPSQPQPVKVVSEDEAVIEAAQKVSRGVVKIISTHLIEPSGFFFSLPPLEQTGIGSGFVFEYEGKKLILTNTHVVGGANRLVVKTIDGSEFEAKKLGADPANDIAVIEPVAAPVNLVALPLGDSAQVQVGQRVIAVGNPFDFENTVTAGIISAKGPREIAGKKREVLQTDAAINTGNSGGPLVDLGGNVIGINFAIFSPTKTNLGIGFAIPINQAKEMMYFLVNRGPWVGLLNLQPNSQGLARYLQLRTDKGLVVIAVAEGSPVAQAGIEPGDVLLEVDGEPVSEVDKLRKKIRSHKIGETIRLTVQRGNQLHEVEVKAGTIPEGYY